MATDERHFDNAKDLALFVAGYMWQKMKAYVDGAMPKANYSATSYTSFAGGVTSAGTLTVTKKFGRCDINGSVTLTDAVSGWVTLLDSGKVPGPQNGEAIIMTLPSWKAPTTNPARLRIPAGGGLQITRGSANAFWINVNYPIT